MYRESIDTHTHTPTHTETNKLFINVKSKGCQAPKLSDPESFLKVDRS